MGLLLSSSFVPYSNLPFTGPWGGAPESLTRAWGGTPESPLPFRKRLVLLAVRFRGSGPFARETTFYTCRLKFEVGHQILYSLVSSESYADASEMPHLTDGPLCDQGACTGMSTNIIVYSLSFPSLAAKKHRGRIRSQRPSAASPGGAWP